MDQDRDLIRELQLESSRLDLRLTPQYHGHKYGVPTSRARMLPLSLPARPKMYPLTSLAQLHLIIY